MRRIAVRGPFHERLRAALLEATRAPGCDQTSLAEALQRDQSGISKYLRNDPKAGTLDLDEADRALRHCGFGGLADFVAHAQTDDDLPLKLRSFLREHAEFRQLLEDLSDVPRPRLAEVLAIWQPTVRALRRIRRVGRPPGTTGGTRTTTGSKPRR